MKHFLKKAKAFIFCGKEDFGIALLEPQVCGTPVIAYGDGGAMDTVVDKKTGIIYNDQTVDSLREAIDLFEQSVFDYDTIRKHALGFSIDNFKSKFQENVAEVLA